MVIYSEIHFLYQWIEDFTLYVQYWYWNYYHIIVSDIQFFIQMKILYKMKIFLNVLIFGTHFLSSFWRHLQKKSVKSRSVFEKLFRGHQMYMHTVKKEKCFLYNKYDLDLEHFSPRRCDQFEWNLLEGRGKLKQINRSDLCMFLGKICTWNTRKFLLIFGLRVCTVYEYCTCMVIEKG